MRSDIVEALDVAAAMITARTMWTCSVKSESLRYTCDVQTRVIPGGKLLYDLSAKCGGESHLTISGLPKPESMYPNQGEALRYYCQMSFLPKRL